jgi:hypothetical protein
MNRVLSMTLSAVLLAATVALAADRLNEIQAPRAPDEIVAPTGSRGGEVSP